MNLDVIVDRCEVGLLILILVVLSPLFLVIAGPCYLVGWFANRMNWRI